MFRRRSPLPRLAARAAVDFRTGLLGEEEAVVEDGEGDRKEGIVDLDLAVVVGLVVVGV